MRVRFIKSSANPAGAYPVGRVETFPDHVGQQLVDSGVAEEMETVREQEDRILYGTGEHQSLGTLNVGRSESATIAPSEAGVKPGPKPRGRRGRR